ncbi:hypothetical protein ABFV83_03725 [Lacrimispora sp. BS-2]|uniref:Uncharacterized protein n=1 Tax=Lacrimispora sp. BS-2 TaxID=3151850 RepID=A0AAU7PRK0_9FIRM
MNREDTKRLVQGLIGKQQIPDFGLEETGKTLPLRPMIEKLVKLSETEFGMYAWSREPLERKFDQGQKLRYILEAGRCGRKEAALLKEKYKTGDPDIIARKMGLKVLTPDIPIGGGHVIFAQYVEPDEVTIFMDGVERAERLIADHFLGGLLEHVDVYSILLAHEIFHGVEYRKEDSIYTKTEKVELWKGPFSNKSRLVCLGEIAGMEFAREMLGISFSPYVLDVLLMYGYQEDAATALYEEIMDITQKAAD